MKLHHFKNERRWYDSNTDENRGVVIAPNGKPAISLDDAIGLGTRRFVTISVGPGLHDDTQRLENLEQQITDFLDSRRYVFVLFVDSADIAWLRSQRWLDRGRVTMRSPGRVNPNEGP